MEEVVRYLYGSGNVGAESMGRHRRESLSEFIRLLSGAARDGQVTFYNGCLKPHSRGSTGDILWGYVDDESVIVRLYERGKKDNNKVSASSNRIQQPSRHRR